MPWFTAKCEYRSVHSGEEPRHELLGEFRFFLLKSDDLTEGLSKALRLAKAKEHSYENGFGAAVSWKLERIVEIKELIDDELREGSELYSEYFNYLSE